MIRNEEHINTFKRYENEKKSPIVVYGDIGCGKTLFVETICKELGYHLIRFDARTKKSLKHIKEIISDVKTSSIVKSAVFFDEFEVVVDDKLGAPYIIKLLSTLKCLVIISIQKIYLIKIQKEIVNFNMLEISIPSIYKLKSFYESKTSQTIEEEKLQNTLDLCNNDLRKTFNHLLNHFRLEKRDFVNDISKYNDFKNIIQSNDSNIGQKIDILYSDLSSNVFLLYENYLNLSKQRSICTISNNLSMLDILHTNLYQTQHWEMSYIAIVIGFLCSFQHMKIKKDVNIQYGNLMSKLSNIQTKGKISLPFKEKMQTDTYEQMFVTQKLVNVHSISLQKSDAVVLQKITLPYFAQYSQVSTMKSKGG